MTEIQTLLFVIIPIVSIFMLGVPFVWYHGGYEWGGIFLMWGIIIMAAAFCAFAFSLIAGIAILSWFLFYGSSLYLYLSNKEKFERNPPKKYDMRAERSNGRQWDEITFKRINGKKCIGIRTRRDCFQPYEGAISYYADWRYIGHTGVCGSERFYTYVINSQSIQGEPHDDR